MPINILMPALSPTMTEGNLAKWIKKEGDTVNAGDILCEIETDKATMEVEAVDEGILGKIIIQEGAENVAVNEIIAVLLEEGEDASQISLETTQQEEKKDLPEAIPQTETKQEQKTAIYQTQKNDTGRVFASPLAKRIAQQKNINLSAIQGTGPNGRIIKADLNTTTCTPLQSPTVSSSGYQDIKVSLMRKTVAKRLTESKNTVPHFYLTVDCVLDNLLEFRKQINEIYDAKISVNDILIKVCAKTLVDVPHTNVTWHETYIRQYNQADISVAVAIDGGLITPIVFGADKLSLLEISKTVKSLVQKARDGKLQPHEYEGGAFSLSNLGMFGIKQFGAIVNPPQGCILAVGAGEKRVIVKNDAPIVATMMTVTLSVDHRSIDGAAAAEFLKAFKKYVESPALMFI